MQILPNGKSQFIDSAGQPLASGTVGFYFPGTLNPKPTFQDAAGTIANTNPIQLDSRGQAIIWGSGVYRQILKDASGVTIWDQITEDPNAGLTGNMTDAVFVPGDGTGNTFIPGTTDTLTLPVAPGASSNTWIFFDTAYQADNQIESIDGVTLKFTAPIPVGVQEVTVKIGSTIAVGTPPSGSVTDSTIAANAAIQSTKLSFLQAGAGAIQRTVQDKLRERVSVKDFGAKGDGTTDDTAALAAAQAAISVAPQKFELIFPAGIYLYSVSPNWAIQNAMITAQGEVRLRYTGTGNAVILDTGPTINTFTFNVTMRDFIVEAPPTAGHAVFIRSIHHSKLGFKVLGAGPTSSGIEVEFAVCTVFDNCTVTAGEEGNWFMSAQPKYGLHLTKRDATETTSYCTVNNGIFEGIVGAGNAGILLEGALGNVFIGGTSEGCDHGVITAVGSVQNKFFGIDLEANVTRDILEQGQGNEFYGVDSNKLVTILPTAAFSKFYGGTHQSIELPPGVRRPSFTDVNVNRAGGGGFSIGDTLDACTIRFSGCMDMQTQVNTPLRQMALSPPAGPATFQYTNISPNEQQITTSGGAVTAITLTRQGSANTTGLLLGVFSLTPGDTLSIAYSGAAPVMRLYSK